MLVPKNNNNTPLQRAARKRLGMKPTHHGDSPTPDGWKPAKGSTYNNGTWTNKHGRAYARSSSEDSPLTPLNRSRNRRLK